MGSKMTGAADAFWGDGAALDVGVICGLFAGGDGSSSSSSRSASSAYERM